MAATDTMSRGPRLARDNPFAVDRVLRVRYRFATGSLNDLCDRLASSAWRGAIVGPHGTGKTTLLEDLADHLRAQGWKVRGARLTAERPHFSRGRLRQFFDEVTRDDIILLDGAEQLSRLAWRRFRRRCRAARGLVITSHRAGMLPTLWRAETSLATLNHVIEQLVPASCTEVHDEAVRLFAHHQGNIRDVIRSLFDAWAEGRVCDADQVAISS